MHKNTCFYYFERYICAGFTLGCLTESIFITSIEKQEGAAASLSSYIYSILGNSSHNDT